MCHARRFFQKVGVQRCLVEISTRHGIASGLRPLAMTESICRLQLSTAVSLPLRGLGGLRLLEIALLFLVVAPSQTHAISSPTYVLKKPTPLSVFWTFCYFLFWGFLRTERPNFQSDLLTPTAFLPMFFAFLYQPFALPTIVRGRGTGGN